MAIKTESEAGLSKRAWAGRIALGASAPLTAFVGAITLGLVWGYLTAVFLLDEPSLPIRFGRALWLATTLSVVALGYGALVTAFGRGWLSLGRVRLLLISTVSLLVSVLLMDTAYTLYLNSTASPYPDSGRVTDEHTWVGELYPRLYFPTDRGFRIHKPGVRVTGTHFGLFYRPSMLASPTLVEHVLEQNTVTIAVNDRGFRESSLMDDATIFTLGDSFTFAWGVDEASGWPGLLESVTGQTVYNLGIHDASPKQELGVLEFVLRTYEESRNLRHLLWTIYEGNDLEESFAEFRPEPLSPQDLGRARGTVLGLLTSVPDMLKEQSVIWQLRSGRVSLAVQNEAGEFDPYSVDGIPLLYPLYYSEALGFRLFYREYVRRAQAPQSYVQDHPNRERLEVVFHDMAALAREFDFDVTVLLAPTAARLHGPFFEDFPEISERPYFLDYVATLSGSVDFEVLDLHELLKPYAASDLLFFRDDDHFNHLGHEVVAGIIQQELFAR